MASARTYVQSGALPAKAGDTAVIGTASAGSPVALPIRIWSSRSGRTPIARATSWPLGRPTCSPRSRLRVASEAGPVPVAARGRMLSGKTSELSMRYEAWGTPTRRGASSGKKNFQSTAKFLGEGRKPPTSALGSPLTGEDRQARRASRR